MTDKGPRDRTIPPGDDKPRLTCPECSYIAYENPKIVNAVVAVHKGKILLCRRAIDPRKGLWTLPGGFMEMKETVTGGALREAFEEANAKGSIGPLLGVYHSSRTSDVILVFRMDMPTDQIAAGPETLEAKFFDWKDIPWNDLAFPFVGRSLKYYDATKGQAIIQPEIVDPPAPTPVPPTITPRTKI